MTNNVFLPADILLPDGVDMTKWSVIACDQFSSEPAYWDSVEKIAGDSPSALKLIVPEARLETIDPVLSAAAAETEMQEYRAKGIFRTLKDCFIYVERTLSDGGVRRGLVGRIDLEAYDYRPGAVSVICASEKTILSRLPARLEIRKRAAVEMPHIMALIDDGERRVIEPLTDQTDTLELVYDFELMQGGGAIKGWRVDGKACTAVLERLNTLFDGSSVQIIIGDGNHSLAAAKDHWDELKQSLDGNGKAGHPARYALVELCNVYDPALRFEAIHRLATGIDPALFVQEAEDRLSVGVGGGRGYTLRWISAGGTGSLTVQAPSIGGLIENLQEFLDEYIPRVGGGIDYIHGEQSLAKLAKTNGSVGLLLPPMDKSMFFETVTNGGVFPKKSFSIGHARDKRYYLECRAIR